MGAQEGYVQVLPDSTGKKIRNLQGEETQPDGTIVNAMMQVVVPVDENGQPLMLQDEVWKNKILDRLDRIVALLESVAK